MRNPVSCCTFYMPLLVSIFTLVALLATPSIALQPPPPGMIEQMKAEGTFDEALKFAESLGNHKVKAANRGSIGISSDPYTVAELINEHYGKTIADKTASALGSMSPRDFDWLSLDKNYDRVVDERDILALGFPQPKVTAAYPSMGTAKTFCLIIDFSDYPGYFSNAEFVDKLFGEGFTGWFYRSLKYYYTQASYSQLTVDGSVLGWYTAKYPRTYYHPNNNTSYPEDTTRREQLIFEAIDSADDAGTDFSEFDNDNDGYVDYFLVVWSGPCGAWASFWWGYQTSINRLSDRVVDGVRFGTYSWQWERYYGFAQSPPAQDRWDPLVTIHETGHALGLPDYYDYDSGQGPKGGVGRLDMMDGNWGDHNCFSKYVLGWFTPTVAFTNLNNEQLTKSNTTGDAVIFMPGFDPVSPWSEYFMAQNRKKEGVDNTIPTSDLLLWHVDASINKQGYTIWDNSYTAHKLLRLMEADGLEEIENGDGQADTGDFYSAGESLSPTSSPNSNKYDGSNPGITCNDISAPGDNMTADFTMFTSNPPTIDITTPTGGTVNGNVSVAINASDDNAVSKVQLIIDGYLVREWSSGPWTGLSYTWNSNVDFNGSRTVIARAWDAENHVGSDSVTVTVNNSGVTLVNDDFESGLGNWRAESEPLWSQGTYTNWDTRTSPGTPTPLGSGNEAYIKPSTGTEWHIAYDALRSQRINATSFTRPVHVKFFYRAGNRYNNTGALKLWATTDNGATWDELDSLPLSSNWSTYTNVFNLAGQTVYFKLRYTGEFKENDGSFPRSAYIDNFLIRQAPSNPPTLTWSNPTNGATISGNVTFSVNPTDDGTIAQVVFYLNDSLQLVDTSAPWQYTRNTLNDDNHPALKVMAYAIDNHDLTSSKEEITVVLKNQRNFPVSDDLETDTTKWSVSNDGRQPQWTYVSNQGNSGTKSYGWVTGGSWQTQNQDYLWFIGDVPSSGRQTIDLSTPAVSSPILKFYYRGNFPSSGSIYVYIFSTWFGYSLMDQFSTNRANWYQLSVPLQDYIGHSGRILFYVTNPSSTSGGTGIWIDDVSVDNNAPFIVNVNPNRGKVGDSITIVGSAFGNTRGSGEVRFNNGSGGYISQTNVSNWSNTSITCNIPTGAKSHVSDGVWVYQGSQDSNKKPLTVVLTPPNFTGVDEQR